MLSMQKKLEQIDDKLNYFIADSPQKSSKNQILSGSESSLLDRARKELGYKCSEPSLSLKSCRSSVLEEDKSQRDEVVIETYKIKKHKVIPYFRKTQQKLKSPPTFSKTTEK